MNAHTPTRSRSKASAARQEAPATGRISAKIRQAIDAIAIQGLSQRDAARRAGVHEVSLSKALAKPHIRAALDERKAQAALEADQLKGIAKAIAIQEGIRLMTGAASEAVRAKMVEFFAGEAKGPAVAVQINAGQFGGYSYRRPDNATGAIDAQPTENAAKAGPVDQED